MGRGKGKKLRLSNALTIAKRLGSSVILPVQKGIFEWMGDAEVRCRDSSLIGEAQIRFMQCTAERDTLPSGRPYRRVALKKVPVTCIFLQIEGRGAHKY